MKRIEFLLRYIRIDRIHMPLSFLVLIGFVLVLGFGSCDKCPHDPVYPCDMPFSMELVDENGINLFSGTGVQYYYESVKVYKEDGEAADQFGGYTDRLIWTPIELGDCGDTENRLRYRYFVHLDDVDIDTVDFVFELKSIECENVGLAYQEVYYNDSLYFQSDIDNSTISIQFVK